MKKLISLCLALIMLASTAVLFSSCGAPPLEDIYDRVVELIESSREINTVIYGAGMPVYHTDSEYVTLTLPHLYYGYAQRDNYEFVTEHTKFPDEASVITAAKKVYGTTYLEILTRPTFTGYAIEDGVGSSVISRARYLETTVDTVRRFCQSTEEPNIKQTAMRVFDYSTMQVHSLGRSEACSVTIDSYLENKPDQIVTMEIYLVRQEGAWYLDSFTGA